MPLLRTVRVCYHAYGSSELSSSLETKSSSFTSTIYSSLQTSYMPIDFIPFYGFPIGSVWFCRLTNIIIWSNTHYLSPNPYIFVYNYVLYACCSPFESGRMFPCQKHIVLMVLVSVHSYLFILFSYVSFDNWQLYFFFKIIYPLQNWASFTISLL